MEFLSRVPDMVRLTDLGNGIYFRKIPAVPLLALRWSRHYSAGDESGHGFHHIEVCIVASPSFAALEFRFALFSPALQRVPPFRKSSPISRRLPKMPFVLSSPSPPLPPRKIFPPLLSHWFREDQARRESPRPAYLHSHAT